MKSEIQNMDDPEEPNLGLNNEISKIEHVIETEDKINIDNNINFTPDRINNLIDENKDNKNDNKYEKNKFKNEKEEILNDEDPEFLHKKLLEEKELIKQKQEENRILKQKIAEYENRKKSIIK